MAYEIDGNGRIKVFSFTVSYTDSESGRFGQTTRNFTDYTVGWSWAREEGVGWEGCDINNSYNVTWDYDWITPEELEEIQDCVD